MRRVAIVGSSSASQRCERVTTVATDSMSTIENTLAICTYNRAESLRRTLESVREAVTRTSTAWEVLVIDNNSTDDTADAIGEFTDRLPLRYLFESKQGLSHGRNRALAECRGDLLVFTDDDVILDAQYLCEYEQARTTFLRADYFGGRIKPHWTTPRPEWLKNESMALLSGLLGNFDLGQRSRTLHVDDPHPFGANFAITRSLFDRVESFRTDLGVTGSVPGRGEEAEYLDRAANQGFSGAYLAGALCRHTIRQEQLLLGHLFRYGVQKGIAETRIRKTQSAGALSREILYAVRGLGQLVRGRGDRFRQCVINMGIQRGLRSAGTANQRDEA